MLLNTPASALAAISTTVDYYKKPDVSVKGGPMIVNERGRSLIKEFEGLRLKAYKCPAGVWTIGYGHTGNDVKPGMVITNAEAERLLRIDLLKFERGVDNLVKVPLNENQFSALVSFTYNVGLGAFSRSTLLRKLNAGDYAGAAEEFKRWNRGGGTVLPGLVRRRNAEKALFLTK